MRHLRGRAKKALFDWPDPKRERAWCADAVERFAGAWASEEYEAVVSSGPPWVCHKLGRHIATAPRVPWFADYRDLWTNGTYYSHPARRRQIEGRIERHWLDDATAITAIAVMTRRCPPRPGTQGALPHNLEWVCG